MCAVVPFALYLGLRRSWCRKKEPKDMAFGFKKVAYFSPWRWLTIWVPKHVWENRVMCVLIRNCACGWCNKNIYAETRLYGMGNLKIACNLFIWRGKMSHVGVQRKSDKWLLARIITCDTGSVTVTHYAFMLLLWTDRCVKMTETSHDNRIIDLPQQLTVRLPIHF